MRSVSKPYVWALLNTQRKAKAGNLRLPLARGPLGRAGIPHSPPQIPSPGTEAGSVSHPPWYPKPSRSRGSRPQRREDRADHDGRRRPTCIRSCWQWNGDEGIPPGSGSGICDTSLRKNRFSCVIIEEGRQLSIIDEERNMDNLGRGGRSDGEGRRYTRETD